MIYVCIIVFSSLVLGLEFLIDVKDKELYREPEPGLRIQPPREIDNGGAVSPIDQIKKKVILLIAIQSFVTGVVLILFVKKITIPLRRMFDITANMERGDFGNPIPVYINDEIGRLGWFINDVVSDFSEVIGHVRVTGHRCREKIQSMKAAFESGNRERVLADMESISEEMERLDDMTRDFNLARVDLSRLER